MGKNRLVALNKLRQAEADFLDACGFVTDATGVESGEVGWRKVGTSTSYSRGAALGMAKTELRRLGCH